MDTVKKIKAILERKANLEHNIKNAYIVTNHASMSGVVSFWTSSSSRYDVQMLPVNIDQAISAQIEIDKAELATIDKQLDAIGALMGAGNV